jgi:hypothetical protein
MMRDICKHYISPCRSNSCSEGLNYDDVSRVKDLGAFGRWARLPYVKNSPLTIGNISCPFYEEPSGEEIKESDERLNALMKELDK